MKNHALSLIRLILLCALLLPLPTLAPPAEGLAWGAQRTSAPRTPATRRPARGQTYINRAGVRVQSPTYSRTAPAGATARCRDGSYSFSRSRRGTCSHHGGVAQWLR